MKSNQGNTPVQGQGPPRDSATQYALSHKVPKRCSRILEAGYNCDGTEPLFCNEKLNSQSHHWVDFCLLWCWINNVVTLLHSGIFSSRDRTVQKKRGKHTALEGPVPWRQAENREETKEVKTKWELKWPQYRFYLWWRGQRYPSSLFLRKWQHRSTVEAMAIIVTKTQSHQSCCGEPKSCVENHSFPNRKANTHIAKRTVFLFGFFVWVNLGSQLHWMLHLCFDFLWAHNEIPHRFSLAHALPFV
jgi:hypothetical protein